MSFSSTPDSSVIHNLPKFAQIHIHCQWCCLNILFFAAPFFFWLQSFPASESFPMSRLFISGGQRTGTSASTSALPMGYPEFISFNIDWFDLLEVQGTLESLFQYHSLKVSVLWCSAFFMVQPLHPYMTTGKQTNKQIKNT